MTELNPLKSMAQKIAISAIKPILNDRIRDVTPNLCYEAIIKNGSIWKHTPDDAKDQAENLLQKFGFLYDRFQEKITTELLLERWLKEDRPEIYNVIVGVQIDGDPIGIEWFDEQVKVFKQQFAEKRGKT